MLICASIPNDVQQLPDGVRFTVSGGGGLVESSIVFCPLPTGRPVFNANEVVRLDALLYIIGRR